MPDSPKELKVKADPVEATPEEKRLAYRRLAGAVSHSLKANGEVALRCFGSESINKACKALLVVREFVEPHGLSICCASAFISAEMDGRMKSGISLIVFCEDGGRPGMDGEIAELKVRGDSADVTGEERGKAVKKLAGAIAYSIRDKGVVSVRSFGPVAVGKAVWAIAVSRGLVAVNGKDLYFYPESISAEMNGEKKKGIAFMVFASG